MALPSSLGDSERSRDEERRRGFFCLVLLSSDDLEEDLPSPRVRGDCERSRRFPPSLDDFREPLLSRDEDRDRERPRSVDGGSVFLSEPSRFEERDRLLPFCSGFCSPVLVVLRPRDVDRFLASWFWRPFDLERLRLREEEEREEREEERDFLDLVVAEEAGDAERPRLLSRVPVFGLREVEDERERDRCVFLPGVGVEAGAFLVAPLDDDLERERERDEDFFFVCPAFLPTDDERERERDDLFVDEERDRDDFLVAGFLPTDDERDREGFFVTGFLPTDEERERERDVRLAAGFLPTDEERERERDVRLTAGFLLADRDREREVRLAAGFFRPSDRDRERERDVLLPAGAFLLDDRERDRLERDRDRERLFPDERFLEEERDRLREDFLERDDERRLVVRFFLLPASE